MAMQVKERPIIFNAEMVRAVLVGRKAQTRRIINWRGLDEGLNVQFSGLRASEEPNGWVIESNSRTSSEWRCQPTPCPFGAVGDRLWVRETFRVHSRATDVATLIYKASEQQSWTQQTHRVPIEKCNKPAVVDTWTPSIHMPRWASRITLEITCVRVERLNSMTEKDALAEGCLGGHDSIPGYQYSATPHEHFHHVWQSIYGADSWQANPWVWVIEFKRVEGE